MSLFEDLDLDLDATPFLSRLSASMSAESCSGDVADECRDDAAAYRMKTAAVVAILIAGVIGVAIPLAGKKRRLLRADGGPFVLAKAFAAGVILATGFVHMLHDAQSALTDPCLSKNPWKTFPFSGFVAMLAALLTLVVDFVGTQFYERKHNEEEAGVRRDAAAVATAGVAEEEEIMVVPVMDDVGHGNDDGCGKMHIVGMHAHGHGHEHEHGDVGVEVDDGHVSSHVRHVVVSQILELGIVSHSVIIGLSLGVSQSPCTIRPLIAALSFHQFFEGFALGGCISQILELGIVSHSVIIGLSLGVSRKSSTVTPLVAALFFHQFFEGFALGGCISQAGFHNLKTILMAFFFAITTPGGIALGITTASFYGPESKTATIVQGILDSTSAGILIYMAMVDLIAMEFIGLLKSSSVLLRVILCFALFLGAVSMSMLAIWA